MVVILISTYIIGYVISLVILIKWGKKMGFDYSKPKTYADYDDWNNNIEAYTGISLASWLFILVIIISVIFKGLKYITSKYVKD